MASIREFKPDDVPAVVALFERVYPAHRWASREACGEYLSDVLLGNPWRAPDLPSWVSEDGGRVTGFAGVLPRPMTFRGRPIRAAVGFLYMVDPDRRGSLAALQLIRAALAGPQDLFIADGANDDACRLWRAAGGSVPLLYGLHWTCLLRPARYLLARAARPGVIGRAALALRPAATLADALVTRLRRNGLAPEGNGLTDAELDAATMSSNFADAQRGSDLHATYDTAALAWLLEHASRKTRHGKFRCRAVFDHGRALGWFVYYVRRGEVGEVLQLATLDGSLECILQQLLADARRHGATAVRGRLDPRHLQTLSARRCWLRPEGTWTLAHSRRPELVAALERGDAGLSRLDGEWWLRFLGG